MAFVEAKGAGEIASVNLELSTLHDTPSTSPADGFILITTLAVTTPPPIPHQQDRPAHRRRGDPGRPPHLPHPLRHPAQRRSPIADRRSPTRVNPAILINTTSYPVDLSLGATWNPDLVYREATQISDEAREVVRDNRLDLNFYSPTINLARDPRWGRNDEAFSEDPLLTAALAAQFVNGMEGKDPAGRMLPGSGGYLKTSTTLKHYAANNSEFDRLRGSANMDDRTLREYYTAQFREVIRRSSPASIMTS